MSNRLPGRPDSDLDLAILPAKGVRLSELGMKIEP